MGFLTLIRILGLYMTAVQQNMLLVVTPLHDHLRFTAKHIITLMFSIYHHLTSQQNIRPHIEIMTSQLSSSVNVTQNININIINPQPDLTFMHSPSLIRMDTFTPGMWIGFGGRIGDRTISTVLKVKN